MEPERSKGELRGNARALVFLRESGVEPRSFVLPALFAMGAAVLEGLSLGLLVPLANGVLSGDTTSVRGMPVFRWILAWIARWTFPTNGVVFVLLVGAILAFTVLKNALEYGSALGVARLVRRFSNRMRKRVFARYLSFGKLYFDRSSVGHLHNVLLNFTGSLAYRLSELHQVFIRLFMLLAYLSVMIWISPKLTALVLCLFPVLQQSSQWLIDRIKAGSRAYADSQAVIGRNIYNILSGIALVKSYTREEAEERRFDEVSDLIERIEFSLDKKRNLVGPVQEIVTLSFMILLLGAMAFIVVEGRPGRVPGMLVFFLLLKRCATSVSSLNSLRASLATVSGPMDEILAMLDDQDKHFIPDGKENLGSLKSGIEFKSLSYSYASGVSVLQNVSFFVPKGKLTALAGPSGAGKTTLISLLLRFYDSPPQAIFIDGADIRSFTLKSLRTRIAVVSQEALLFNDSLRANISYGLNGRVNEESLARAVRSARLQDFVSRLPQGLDTLIGDRGVQLSGGEKQRVSIARAMLKGAEILILDEATSSLDSETEKAIQEAIDEMIQDKTAIVIAHRLSTIQKADQVVFMEGGRVVERGTPEELLRKEGRFFNSWQAQRFF